jgi:bifunctional non-homologous end joining protein LigD
MHLTSEHAVRRLSQSDPVIYMIFDVLWLEGHSLLELTYEERRAKLPSSGSPAPTWQTPANHVGNGAGLLEASRAQGLEGIIAKRLDCPYTPGRRANGWVRSRTSAAPMPSSAAGCRARRGAPAASARSWSASTRTASCATRPRRQRLHRGELARLGKLLDGLARDDSAFEGRQPPKETRFVEPRLVAVVDYSRITHAKTLRQPSYKGLRDDIAPEDVGPPDEA